MASMANMSTAACGERSRIRASSLLPVDFDFMARRPRLHQSGRLREMIAFEARQHKVSPPRYQPQISYRAHGTGTEASLNSE